MGDTTVESPHANGILLLYHHHLAPNAMTIMEHVGVFGKYSTFPVYAVNTELGFPDRLHNVRFPIVVLHYSLAAAPRYRLGAAFMKYLAGTTASYKIAFFQDEYRFCKLRFDFVNRVRVNCIYTLIEPEYWDQVYREHTGVEKLIYTLPGYVSDDLVALAKRLRKPDAARTIDVGYRGRPLPYATGQGGQEKTQIALEFRRRAAGLGLRLNIETAETRRIYGQSWYHFLADCRTVLGVEAGVSVFDIDDTVTAACEAYLQDHPQASFAEVQERILRLHEDKIFYRTISPRHFEAAALRVCQVLFEGKYSGLMQPFVHYLPLKKDFSNFDQIVALSRSSEVRARLTANAYRDLIASGKYTYHQFVHEFDAELMREGFSPEPRPSPEESAHVTRLLHNATVRRTARAQVRALAQRSFPGRDALVPFARPLYHAYVRWRERQLAGSGGEGL